jgi:thiol-disulfide isomerase/thioredoxin
VSSIFIKSLVTAILVCLNLKIQAADLQLGVSQPQYQAKLLDGQTVLSSAQLKGRVVLVNFWATWCAPCKEEMPAIEAFYQAHKDQGFEVLAVSMDDAKNLNAVKAYAKPFSFSLAHKSDANMAELGRVWRLPSTFVMDRDGVLRKNGHVGDAAVTSEMLESLITPLLQKRP